MPAPRWDSALGDLAYPVFLLHIPCRAAMSGLLGRSDAWVDLLAIAATFVLSTSSLLWSSGLYPSSARSCGLLGGPFILALWSDQEVGRISHG
jgi:hypothetical protein